MSAKFGVEPEVLPGSQKRVDEYHAELADIRFRALCNLLLEAFEHRDDSLPVLGVDLLKDAARHHADCNQFLKFVVAHGVPSGLGEWLEEAVECEVVRTPVYREFVELIERPIPVDVFRAYVNRALQAYPNAVSLTESCAGMRFPEDSDLRGGATDQ